MASGKPPRHSGSGKDPVTIDLEANDASETEGAADTTGATAAEKVDDTLTTAPETAESPTDDAPAQSEPAAGDMATAEPEPESDAAAAFSEGTSTATAPPPPRTTTSGSLAAGLLGGLVALAAAGALQYAGVLGTPGASDTDNGARQAIEAQLAALKAEVDKAAQPAQSVDLAPLEERLSGIEQKLAEAPPAASGAAADISGLEATVASMTTELESVKAALAESRQQQQAAREELASRLSTAEQKLEEPSSDARMARAVAATALKTAIERGGPFLAELDALASVAPDDAAVAGLKEDAATGVSSRADLARAFPAAANTMLDAMQDTGAEDGVFTRLMNSASSLVRVRAVGNVEGDTPEAIIARIENKIVNGDLKGAALEWETLPEKARTAGADFKQALDRRIRVEDLVGNSISGAMSGNNQG